jgi:hypothetical protein
MRRRRLLAALSLLPAALAGCSGRTDPAPPERTETETSTPVDTATPLTATEPRPDPPTSPTAAEAVAFVREYERVAVANQLVEYGGGSLARRPRIGDPKATVVVAADEGFYLFGACEAEARYGDRGGYGINRHEVPHFLGRDGRHEVAPWSAIVCDTRNRPYAAADPDENVVVPGESPGAEIHVFRFDGAARGVSVTVEYLDAGTPKRAFSTVVEASSDAPDPAYEYVLSNVAVRRGRYRVTATVPDASSPETEATATWTLDDPEAPSWTGRSVFVAENGRPHVALPDVDDDALVPGRSMCFRHAVSHEDDEKGG